MDDLSRQLSSLSMMSTNVNHICNDIIFQILSWLPVDSLRRFKSVCKSWLSLITNPKFAKLHTDHHHHHHHHHSLKTGPTIMLMSTTHYSLKSMDKLVSSSSSSSTVLEELDMVYPFDSTKYEFEIVGSCNGLICISMVPAVYVHLNDRKEIVCLWNPSTKEFKQLPSHEDIDDDAPPFEFPPYHGNGRRSEYKIANYGFGYDHVMEDYKVIASVQWFREMVYEWFSEMDDEYVMDDNVEDDMYHNELKVYTLGTDSWRRIQGTPYENEWSGTTLNWSFVNGAFHRIAELSSSNVRIDSFDIVEEVYREVPKPNCLFSSYVWELAVLRGCLCLCYCGKRFSTEQQGYMLTIWMMMNYGVKKSWTKLFNISNGIHSHRFKPVWLCRNGKLFIEDESNSELVIYDPKHNEVKLLLESSWNVRFQAEIYIASLVSLKSQKEIEKELIIC